ncbi:MAG TPA: hypothetical protein VH143_22875 [Kofleriaceae bacterium]|jgi:hypothetical protein|nr:hypothetical protein [Kofleriaceae bacterium]
MAARWLPLLLVVCAACQHDIKTPFPAGLEPLETNPVPEQTAPYSETLATATATGAGGEVEVYARGYVLADSATVWTATKTPQAVVASCTTDAQSFTVGNEPQYEFSFLVAYTVNDVLTVQWNDQWRYGTIDAETAAEPFFGMITHQKTDGSSFITTSEGTIEVTATDDPNATELAFVEHLQAIAGSSDDVIKSTTHVFDSIVALSHGGVIPPCP